MESFGKFVAGAIGLVFGIVLRAYVIVVLWSWFVVSLFNLPQLAIVNAIGISLIIGLFNKVSVKSDESFKESVIASISQSLVTLSMGYVVTLFM